MENKNINEARVDIYTKRGKYSAEDLLLLLHNSFKTGTWKNADAKKIKAQLTDKIYLTLSGFLINNDYIDRAPGRIYSITTKGLNHLSKNTNSGAQIAPSVSDQEPELDPDAADDNVAKGVQDMTDLKVKKYIVPKVGNNSKYLGLMRKILDHMHGFAEKRVKTSYMLGGDPGTGKTSMVKSLSTLTGLPLVVIEAPHITQEHLINIPFLVIDGNKEYRGNVAIDSDSVSDSEGVVDSSTISSKNMKIVQAESNLVTRLKNKTKKTPEEIQAKINKHKVLRDIYPLLKTRIDMVAPRYNSILFLDEFYRTSSIKIRNVLRNILNGKIGNDKIPNGVYIIMATNLEDEGVDDIPLNQDFHLINHNVTSKEDFMAYMYSKYVNDPDEIQDDSENEQTEIKTPSGISIKPEVWNKFMETLTDEDLGFEDETADVRLSPRRLEQIIIYVDAALPVSNIEDAKNLIAFIRNNFTNYLDLKESKTLVKKFEGIISDLMKSSLPEGESLDIDKALSQTTKKSEWRNHLQHEIEMKIRLGENRKYIPVISGQPGVGKTSQVASIAKQMNMGYIHIDTANLNPEDITGMPIADQSGDNITTEFSDPNLYITIMKAYNSLIKKYYVEGREYNVIVLFDELNRASVPVFNAVRKVLLEKEFENVTLESDILIVGAINPLDEGTVEFTSHTRDVLDIIPTAGSFSETYQFISGKKELIKLSDELGFDMHMSVLNLIAELANSFRSKVDNDGKELDDIEREQFWWQDGTNIFYVYPREITEAVANASNQIRNALILDSNYDATVQYTEEEFEELIDTMVNVCADSFSDSFYNIIFKQQIKGFNTILAKKISNTEKYRTFFDGIKSKKSANVINLVQIFNNANKDISFFDKSVIGNYINEFTPGEMIQDLSVITDEFITSLSGKEAIIKIGKVYTTIKKSLAKLNASNNYHDQMNKHLGKKIYAILKSPKVDILEIVDDQAIIDVLNSFVEE